MANKIKRESDLKVGKKYKISWRENFSIKSLEFYKNQSGFKSSDFCKKYDKVIDRKKTDAKFKFLGMFLEPKFNVTLAKVKVLGEELLIPHKMLIKN